MARVPVLNGLVLRLNHLSATPPGRVPAAVSPGISYSTWPVVAAPKTKTPLGFEIARRISLCSAG